MAKTTLTLNKNYFTPEVTNLFLKDFEIACTKMELSSFTDLFLKYDLSFMKDFQEVFDLIAHIMTAWKNPGEDTQLIEVKETGAKCIFCNLGKSVRVFNWTYTHSKSNFPMNNVVYKSKIGFYLEYENNQLIEFGVCNAYT